MMILTGKYETGHRSAWEPSMDNVKIDGSHHFNVDKDSEFHEVVTWEIKNDYDPEPEGAPTTMYRNYEGEHAMHPHLQDCTTSGQDLHLAHTT